MTAQPAQEATETIERQRPRMSVSELNDFGRTRLPTNFFMRDFLYSEIAAVHGLSNIPDDPALAIQAGIRLFAELLEPLQSAFGRITIRSAYRSPEVNALGNRMQAADEPPYKGGRTAAWCTTRTGVDLSCAMLRSGHAARWDRFWRGHRCR